jgi:hypothetical protein
MKIKISRIMLRARNSVERIFNSRFLMGLILLTGILLRLRQFLFNRSLWSDEAFLALNFLNRSFQSLVTEGFQYDQSAPFGFAALTRVFIHLFGNHDIVLRLTPFLTSILTLVCVYFLTLKILEHTAARLVFIGLFSFSPILIYYSSEFKAYSSDLFFAVLLIWVGLEFCNVRFGHILMALVGAISVLFSYISIFVLLPVGVITGLDLALKKKYSQLFRFGLVVTTWLVSFGLLYWFSIRLTLSNSYLFTFWRDGFPPDPVLSTKTIGWLIENYLGIIYFSFRQSILISHATLEEWYGAVNLLLAILVLVGAIWLNKRPVNLWLICIGTIFVNLVMAFAHLYPFRGRLVLYLIVIIYIFAASLIERLWHANLWYTRVLCLGLGVILLVPFMLVSFQKAVSPNNYGDIKNSLAYMENHKKAGDSITLSPYAYSPYMYYYQSYGLDGIRIVDQVPGNLDALEFRHKICQSGVKGRLWIIIALDFYNLPGFLADLKGNVEMIDLWRNDSIAGYLIDLNPGQFCRF